MTWLKTLLARKSQRRNRGEEGFSLIEIMVAVFIMALLSGIVLYNVMNSRDRALVDRARIDIRTIETALYQYSSDMLTFPTTEQGLEALVEAPTGLNRAELYPEGGYFLRSELPADPWGNPYQYRNPGERGRIDIFSFGADGRPGGEDLNADIGNWGEN